MSRSIHDSRAAPFFSGDGLDRFELPSFDQMRDDFRHENALDFDLTRDVVDC